MKLLKGRNFLTWKWKNLRRRREYFFCLFNLLLAFIWISIGGLVNDDSYNFRRTYHTQPFAFTALIVFSLHLFYFCSFLYPNWFRRIIHGKPKMTYFTYLSFLIGSWILVFLRSNELDNDGNAAIAVLFVLTIDVGIAVLHHMGLANPYMVAIKALSFLSLLIFIGFTKFPAPVVLALLLSFFVHHCNGVVIEQELTRTFAKLDFLEQNPEEYGISKEFSKDFLKALVEIDSVLIRQLRELNLPMITHDSSHDPLNGQYSEKSSNTAAFLRQSSVSSRGLGAMSHSQRGLSPPTLKLFHFNKTMTDCLEMKYLKNALYHSITSSNNVDKAQYDKFFFHKMSRFIFALLESSCRHSLPLFLGNLSKEVVISAPLELFQLILYLLLHDYVKGRKGGICFITCEKNNDLWELHVKFVYREVIDTSTPISDRSKTNSNREEEEEPTSEAVNGVGGNGTTQTVSTTTNTLNDITTSPVKKEKVFPPTLVVPNLMADRHPIEDSTSMERLADRIFYKYFHTRIEKMAVEVKEGVSFYHKVVPLSRSYFTFSEKMLPPNAASASSHISSAAAIATENLRLSFILDQLSESQWILLGSKVYESGLLSYLKEKFQMIHLPVTLATMDEYRTLLVTYRLHNPFAFYSLSSSSSSFRGSQRSSRQRYSATPTTSSRPHPLPSSTLTNIPHALFSEVIDTEESLHIKKNLFVLIPESHLSKLHAEQDFPYLRSYHKELIIICDLSPYSNTTLAAINHRYEINATHLLKAKPSLLELLNLVQMMSARVEPRGIVHDEYLPRLFCVDDRTNNESLGKINNGTNKATDTARIDEEEFNESKDIPPTASSPPPLPNQSLGENSSHSGRNSPVLSSTSTREKKNSLKKESSDRSTTPTNNKEGKGNLLKHHEFRQQWIGLMVKLQSNITSYDASRSIVAIKKMIDHRLSVLHHPERSSPRSSSTTSSFNYPLFQTYLSKRKSKVMISSPAKQKAEFVSTFFLPFVTILQEEWRQPSIHFTVFLVLLEEMIRNTKLFRLGIVTFSAEALYDIFSCLKTALTADHSSKSITYQEEAKQRGDETSLFESKESHDEFDQQNHTSATASAPSSISKYHQYLYNIQNEVQIPERLSSSFPTQILDSDIDGADIRERLVSVIQKCRESSSPCEKNLLSPLLQDIVDEGFDLLRSTIWEAAFED